MDSAYGELAFWVAIGVINIAFWSALAPVFKAWADRIRGPQAINADVLARLEALEAERPVTGETDLVYRRIAELEERLEFAERLLAQGREPARIEEGP
ncbi:MAG TPA: hypothetical protein PKA66_07690 [Gemmatimonadales bacterium]|nr:hypothetical protein [Gemmatimonadales bacterium]